ncbi:MAG: hypothetical protein WA946_05170 [Nitrospirota bacterium]
MPPKKEMNNESDTFTETADAFSAMLIQFIKVREGYPHNHEYEWSPRDILYVQAALDEMTADQRNAFRESIKEYQILKVIRVPNQGSA